MTHLIFTSHSPAAGTCGHLHLSSEAAKACARPRAAKALADAGMPVFAGLVTERYAESALCVIGEGRLLWSIDAAGKVAPALDNYGAQASWTAGMLEDLPTIEEIREEVARRVAGPLYLIDGQHEGTFGDFCEDNAESLDREEIAQIKALVVGEILTFGGGASATFIVRRIR